MIENITQFKAGKPKTGGRKAGTPNKHTARVKELAGQYVEDAIAALVQIAKDDSAPVGARIIACRELLDRYEGKPAQRIEQVIKDESSSKYSDIVQRIRDECEREGE